jgi:hypothetical protein
MLPTSGFGYSVVALLTLMIHSMVHTPCIPGESFAGVLFVHNMHALIWAMSRMYTHWMSTIPLCTMYVDWDKLN